MSQNEPFEVMLTGGHPNSLGRTVEVVDLILTDQAKLEELYQCYFSDDEVVRLRVSNAFKRIWRENPEWVVPYIDCFISTISQIDQDSARWTTAQLFLELQKYLSDEQREQALAILKTYLSESKDWIVLNNTIDTLGTWAKKDGDLKAWLRPHLKCLAKDSRKSVAKKAGRFLEES